MTVWVVSVEPYQIWNFNAVFYTREKAMEYVERLLKDYSSSHIVLQEDEFCHYEFIANDNYHPHKENNYIMIEEFEIE